MADKRIDELTSLASVETTDLIPVWDSSVGQTKQVEVGDVSHTKLADVGTNAHSVIDTFIASKAQASGLASLDGSSLVVQNPANATATPTASKIPIADISGKLDAWVTAELTANQLAAIAGTSGTPSGTNKFVTNDDTATAATADKVARRLAGGNITVVTETQANNSTNAASTAYVDLAVANADTTKLMGAGTNGVKTYINSTLLFLKTNFTGPVVNGFTESGIADLSAGNATWNPYYLDIAPSSDSAYSLITTSPIAWAVTDGYIRFSTNKDLFMEFHLSCSGDSGSEQMAWGLSENTTVTGDFDSQAADGIAFTYNTDGKLYAHTSNEAVGHTETEITGVTLSSMNTYRIEWNPTVNAKFYVNGVLKATITTNLPDSASMKFVIGGTGNAIYPRMITAPMLSIER